MELTWKSIAHGCERQAYYVEEASALYHHLYKILEVPAAAQRDELPLTPEHAAFVNLIEHCWRERPLSGWTEATLLLAAALHAAVLEGDPAAEPLHRFYATVGGQFDPEQDVEDLRTALFQVYQNPGEIMPWFLEEGRVQTNEASRGIAWLLPAYVFSAWQPDLTITLVDLGTSAGLNMAADFQSWEWLVDGQTFTLNQPPWLVTQQVHQEKAADPGLLHLLPGVALPKPPIVQRVGFDQFPLNINHELDRLGLRACLWGDQPERMARFDQAVQGYNTMLDAGVRPRYYAGDILEAVPLLSNLITEEIKPPHLILVFNSAVTVYIGDQIYDQLRTRMMQSFTNLPAGIKGLWLELEPPRYNEEVEHPRHFLLKAKTPFMGGISTVFLGELEAHPLNFYVRPGWESLRMLLDM